MERKIPQIRPFVGLPARTRWSLTRTSNQFEFGSWHVGSRWAHHELDQGGWWFRDPVENASFMPQILATACIHSVILPLLHSCTSFINIVTFPCSILGTFSLRSGLLAPIRSFTIYDTRGIFLWTSSF